MEIQEPKINKNNKIKEARSILYRFFKFIKSPVYEIECVKQPKLVILRDILKLFSFAVVLAILSGLFASKISTVFNYDQSQNSVFDLFSEMPFYVVLLLTVLWAPITEELAFRMGMRYSKFKLSFSFAILFGVIFEIFLAYSSVLDDFIKKITFIHGVWFSIILFFLISFAFGLIILFFLEKYDLDKKIINFYQKYFRIIFYFLTVSFALVHVMNYYNITDIWFITPLFVIPQFIIGLLLGYIRVHFGLQWSIFTHFLYNSILTLPILLFSSIDNGKFLDSADITESQIEKLSEFDQGVLLLGAGLEFLFVLIIFIFFMISIVEYFKCIKKINIENRT